ncbi:hypothetical protein KUC_2116 [Vreelandella boliviensis LC1]|uniref:Uncharacterized protein n=1 Tax=Vreelandella boliviensis LC1 TaxID=1072583 RepID=A0A7U9C2Q7_9GAMM|nr:hypothetical protein KUC_2116 [Halomonas boliviensis LC1]
MIPCFYSPAVPTAGFFCLSFGSRVVNSVIVFNSYPLRTACRTRFN